MPDLSTERLQGLLETSTPDPWTVAADCQTGRDYWHVDVPIERHQNVSEGILATIQRFGSHAAQADANADLMGMARDLAREVLRLRAVLQQAFDLIEVVYPDGDHPVTGECLADLWEGWKTRALEVTRG